MCESQIQNLGRSKTVDNRSKEEVYGTWTVRELIGKEEVLKYYNIGIKIAFIGETKKKLKGTKDTRGKKRQSRYMPGGDQRVPRS